MVKVIFILIAMSSTALAFSELGRYPAAGTDGRTEREFKLAFSVPLDRSTEDVKAAVLQVLQQTIGTLKFDKLIDSEFQISGDFKPFVFKDIYLDTPDFQILRANSAYRLRYRWPRLDYYVRHRLLPFFKDFYPNRCEIQFKGNYQWDGNVVSVQETRFEFRNESHPFFLLQNAPKAPWPEAEYLGYAQSGLYGGYAMKPTLALVERIPGARKKKVSPAVEVTTIRERLHLRVRNPWGMGPNPDQVFIVTLDRSEFTPRMEGLGGRSQGNALLEIEVEPDRSTLEGLQRVGWLKRAPGFGGLNDLIQPFTEKAKDYLHQDLDTLRFRLSRGMTEALQQKPLPGRFKYARAHEYLGSFVL